VGEVMSRLMSLFGIVLAVAGLALIFLSVVNPGLMQVYGVTPEAGAILRVGGVLALGLGGVISAIESNGVGMVEPVATTPKVVVLSDAKTTSSFGRKGAETAALDTGAALVEVSSAKSNSTSVAETISALEQAKSDIKTALGGMEDMTQGSEDMAPVPDAVHVEAAPATVGTEVAAEGEDDLYVVEEKIIRGRPSRILSDDTVEAETDEGWMRFENLEHLNEYLDSVEEGQA
jgi:hypothetical protein